MLLRTAGAYPLKPAMDEVSVPNRALIVVGDGEKALFLRNKGSPQELRLEVEHILGHENPATHEQGTDKPGRSLASAGTALAAQWKKPIGIAWAKNASPPRSQQRCIASLMPTNLKR